MCYCGGSFGHVKAECAASIECSKCGKTGHHQSICGKEDQFRKESMESLSRMRRGGRNAKPLHNNNGKQKLYTVDGEAVGDFVLK